MDTNNKQPDNRIIKYLDGELTGDELNDFEKTLAENASIKAELQSMELAKSVVQHYGLKHQVARVHGSMMAELNTETESINKRGIYPFIRNTMRIAAALFGFMVLFGVYEFVSVSPSKLARENYRRYEVSIERGTGKVSAIETAYLSKNFKLAINYLKKEDSITLKEHFLGALSYLADQQPANAIKEFEVVLNKPDAASSYKDDAEYYLAISYLQNNQPKNAEELFKKIHNDKDHLYHNKVSWWTMLKIKILILKNPGH